MEIKIMTVENVKKFVNIAQKQECDIDIKSGNRYVIDAKSIMGIFSLDLSKPLTLVIHEEDENKKHDIEKAFVEFTI